MDLIPARQPLCSARDVSQPAPISQAHHGHPVLHPCLMGSACRDRTPRLRAPVRGSPRPDHRKAEEGPRVFRQAEPRRRKNRNGREDSGPLRRASNASGPSVGRTESLAEKTCADLPKSDVSFSDLHPSSRCTTRGGKGKGVS